MTGFRERYKAFLTNSAQSGKTLDGIYERAHIRQFDLVSLCFDNCIRTQIEHCTLNGNLHTLESKKLVAFDPRENSYTVTASSKNFRKYGFDRETASNDELASLRKEMETWLRETSEIYMRDGDVKSIERAREKASDKYNGRHDMLDDINRITILSSEYKLIPLFLDRLNSANGENICSKEDWEIKPFGLLSRSSYLRIEGFPAEIHYNEPDQIALGHYLTHHVYQAMRINTMTEEGKEKFNVCFSNLFQVTAVTLASAQ